jgi:hypothetical protein
MRLPADGATILGVQMITSILHELSVAWTNDLDAEFAAPIDYL